MGGKKTRMVVGDFNCILRAGDRCGGGIAGTYEVDASGKELGDMINIFQLRDVGKEEGFTFFLVIKILFRHILIFVLFIEI